MIRHSRRAGRIRPALPWATIGAVVAARAFLAVLASVTPAAAVRTAGRR
ncbi:hypothetical protein [Streptomyces sp. NPDC017260]